MFKIPEANTNKVWQEGDVTHVVLQPGDATNYDFSYSVIGGLALINIRQPHRGKAITIPVRDISAVPANESAYTDGIVLKVAEQLGNTHSAAIILLATDYLMHLDRDAEGAAEYAMRIRSY